MKTGRFPAGKSVNVSEYLREHGNPDAAEEWEKMNEKYKDKFKSARTQKLLTQKDRKRLPPLYSQDDNPDPMVWVKFFNPYGEGTWLATEFDGRDTFFGLVDLGYPELGYFSLRELQSIRGPGGVQGIERDAYFKPKPLSEAKRQEIRASKTARGDIPKRVEELADEIRKDMPDYSDAQAYATAWSIYCKYIEPGSDHCTRPSSGYFVGREAALESLEELLDGKDPDTGGWDPGEKIPQEDWEDEEEGEGSLIPGLELNKAAGSLRGPGIPDGTGPYGGTPECQVTEDEWSGEEFEEDLHPEILEVDDDEDDMFVMSARSIHHAPVDEQVSYVMEELKKVGDTGIDIRDLPLQGVQEVQKRGLAEAERGRLYLLPKGRRWRRGSSDKKSRFEEDEPADPTKHMTPEEAAKWEYWNEYYTEKLEDEGESDEKEGRFEEGEPADPTKHMTPEEAAKWEYWNEYYTEKLEKEGRKEKGKTSDPTEGMDPEDAEKWENHKKKAGVQRQRLSWGTRTAGRPPAGRYGFTKKIQADCERAARKVSRSALKLAKRAYKKDERVAPFLSTHGKRSQSLTARILTAAMKEIGPKVASMGKTAGYSHYWTYLPRSEMLDIRGFGVVTNQLNRSLPQVKQVIKQMEAFVPELESNEQGPMPLTLMPSGLSKRARNEFLVDFRRAFDLMNEVVAEAPPTHPLVKPISSAAKRLDKALTALSKAQQTFSKNRGYNYRGTGVIARAYQRYIKGLKMVVDIIESAWEKMEQYITSETLDATSFGFTDEEWAKLTSVAKGIIRKASQDMDLAGGDGTGKPLVSGAEIVLNGSEVNGEDGETFYLSQHPDSLRNTRDFCKTNQEPYDAVVVSILAAAQKIAPEAIRVDSDGGSGAIRRVYGSQNRESRFGLYGYPAKTASLGLKTCTSLREEAGRIAAELHGRRADRYDRITGFLKTHGRKSRCMYSRLLHRSYPDPDMKCASAPPKTVQEWIAWED